MIHKAGFTLLETLIAVAIIGVLLSPLLITQGSLLRAVAQQVRAFERILDAKNFLWTARLQAEKQDKPEFTMDKTVPDRQLTLKYQVAPIDKKSALKDFKHVYRERVELTWQQDGRTKKDELVTFVFKPEKPKEKTA